MKCHWRFRAKSSATALIFGLFLTLSWTDQAVGDLVSGPNIFLLDAPSAFTPNQGTSDAKYTVAIGIATELGAEHVASIQICWHQASMQTDLTDCSVAGLQDERYTAWARWERETGFSFTRQNLLGTHDSYFLDAGSINAFDGNTGMWQFVFTISEAMHAADDWQLSVEVCDDQPVCTQDDSITNRSVVWFGYMIQQGNPKDFGEIAPGRWSFAEGGEGLVMANGTSTITYETSDFTNERQDVSPVTPDGGPGSAPPAGFLALDCTTDHADFEASLAAHRQRGSSWLRVSSNPAVARSQVFEAGLHEDGYGNTEWDGWYGCGLGYGGAAASALTLYSSEFWVGIGQFQP